MKNIKAISIAAAVVAASLLGGCATTQPVNLADHDVGKKHKVKITPTVGAIEVMVDGKPVRVERNQDQNNKVIPAFAKTSRKCPPFCIRPITTAKGVQTIAEVEVLQYMKQRDLGDDSVLIVDNRTPDWHKKGTIPGAVNVPFTKINRGKGADDVSIAEALELFGAVEGDKGWDFSKAKTLVMFCNGMWCGQSPLGIAGIMKEGYPAEKIRWYRGGMQDWQILGLTTVK